MRRRIEDDDQTLLFGKQGSNLFFKIREVKVPLVVKKRAGFRSAPEFLCDRAVRRPVPVRNQDLVAALGIVRDRVTQRAGTARSRDRSPSLLAGSICEIVLLLLCAGVYVLLWRFAPLSKAVLLAVLTALQLVGMFVFIKLNVWMLEKKYAV